MALGNKEDWTFVASCGRDRTIQVFRKIDSQLELLQTLVDHAASVTDLIFLDRTTHLLSISGDRTISIQKIIGGDGRTAAFVCARIITLKASPISFTQVIDQPNLIVVSTTDRQIQRYDISSGRLIHSFKILDPASGEAVMMKSLVICSLNEAENASRLLMGVSSTDKSIRIHDFDSGSLLAKEFGQTAISAIGLIERPGIRDTRQQCLISCGFDSTVMMWDLAAPRYCGNPASVTSKVTYSPSNQSPALTTPLRRILSRAEITILQNPLERDSNTSLSKSRTSVNRVRPKTSKFPLTAAPNLSLSPQSSSVDASSCTKGKLTRRSSQSTSSKGNGPRNIPSSKSNCPYLDHQTRRENAPNLNGAAKHTCDLLHILRKSLTSTATGGLAPLLAQDLQSELELTIYTLTENSSCTPCTPIESNTAIGNLEQPS